MIFGINVLYNVLLAIATNISVRLMTGFVVQGHIFLLCTLSEKKAQMHIQVHLNKLECRGKVHLFQ